MRCSCRNCGEYMVQTERGLFSGCKCPACFNVCRDCMGTPQGPKTPEELKRGYKPAEAGPDGDESIRPERDDSDWRKYL